MSQPLELLIDEPKPGHFFWTLVQRTDPSLPPHVVDFAMGPLATRQAAVDAGQASLGRNGLGSGRSWGGEFAETLPMEL